MGQSKDGGYIKKNTLLPEQMSLLQQILGQAGGFTQGAAEGYKEFLPGGGGGDAIKAQAMRDYQQKTIPSIFNAFGSDSKSSSALNQALGASASDLNTNLASKLSEMQLSAAQGLGNLGLGSQQQGLSTPGFAYMQRQLPFWQQALLASIQSGGEAVRGVAGAR